MIIVQKPGFFSTIQDMGRTGFQQYGVIVSGVMDEVAYRIGNALLQQCNTASIEMTVVGGTYQFTKPTAIVLTGGHVDATLQGKQISMNRVIHVEANDVLVCGPITHGVRCYLAVRGGIQVPIVMNSRSTYVKAGIGGYDGRALQKGDELPYEAGYMPSGKHHLQLAAFYMNAPIRILHGTEWATFSHDVQQAFSHNVFTVSLEADRMGYRMIPQHPIQIAKPFQLISEAVTFGTIQMPPNGEPIILMADRQTTGGYPKIAQVIAADLHRLAQIGPNEKVLFEVVSIAEAEAAYEKLQRQLKMLEVVLG